MKYLHTTLMIAAIGVFTSCTVLTPSGPNVPLFREKGEKMINANVIAGGEAVGAELKGALATGNHFYLGGNFTAVSFGEGLSGHMTELSAGGFGRAGKDGIFDMSGGIGFGSAMGHQQFKFYLQPAIGFRREKIEFAAGLKAAYLNAEGTSWEEDVMINSLILEPFILGRFGGKRTKFQVGLNYPTIIASTEGFPLPIMNITLGASFRLGGSK
jgi:hypothetical protein